MTEAQAKAHLPDFCELISLTQLGFEPESFGWRASLYKGLLQTQANVRERHGKRARRRSGVSGCSGFLSHQKLDPTKNGFDTI
jgi:hypothetical protein